MSSLSGPETEPTFIMCNMCGSFYSIFVVVGQIPVYFVHLVIKDILILIYESKYYGMASSALSSVRPRLLSIKLSQTSRHNKARL